MKRRYEALLVLNAQGKEDSVREIIERLQSDFQKEGAEVEQVQKMDRHHFSYMAGALDSGYYVNFIFNADPGLVAKLRTKFKLDPEIYRQNYQRLQEKKEKPAKKMAKGK
ncbi:MAG TPA: 30S ribosomal protein S6 [Candidatus Udaeobacter sp.]|jgi:small subunit ribosomal protein S6|nr:30S ribosomal protein S6 [Candidatus Udaeobacter sp.]